MTDQAIGRPRPVDATTADGANPTVDIRVVLFTLADGKLLVALNDGDGMSLPRGYPDRADALDHSARQIIRSATGLAEQYIEQLYTLSVEGEDDAPWTVIVSYMALISSGHGPLPDGESVWHDVQRLPALSAADAMVVEYAVVRLRAKLGYTNIAFYLVPERFTLTELQTAYQTILSRELDKRNFRRRVIASGILAQTEGKRRDGSHRPAALYRFHAPDDRETYLTPPWTSGSERVNGVAS